MQISYLLDRKNEFLRGHSVHVKNSNCGGVTRRAINRRRSCRGDKISKALTRCPVGAALMPAPYVI
jgi:hypothetical protein